MGKAPMPSPAPAMVVGGIRRRRNVPQPKRTKNDIIVDALVAPRPLWQTANQVQEFMSAELGKLVPMSSVSPALWDLKNNGTIVRNDKLVALAARVEIEEPSFLNENGSPHGDPDVGGTPASDPPQQPSQAHEGR